MSQLTSQSRSRQGDSYNKSKLQKEVIAHVGQMRSLSASERAVKG